MTPRNTHRAAARPLPAVALPLLLLLTGCATCREHPVACSVAGGILVTSVALSVNLGSSEPAAHSIARRMSPCEPIGVTQCGPRVRP